jgi:hypothetical protein
VGFPDEDYRYVTPPPNAKPTQPPTGGTAGSPVHDGTNGELIEVVTPENGPQALALILQSQLTLTSPQAKVVHVDINPIKPTVLPTDGKLSGNVYLLTATALDGQVSVKTTDQTDNTHLISLRVPQSDQAGFLSPVLEYRPVSPAGQAWQALATSKVGNDIYQAPIQGFGEYAMVAQPQATAGSNNGKANVSQATKTSASHKLAIIVTILLVAGAGFAVSRVVIGKLRKQKHGKKT